MDGSLTFLALATGRQRIDHRFILQDFLVPEGRHPHFVVHRLADTAMARGHNDEIDPKPTFYLRGTD
jgi:hypothetical protein